MSGPVQFDEATRPQVKAAGPGTASWVSANAGSGKTKVLTDRVARLLLSGTPPQRVLCLTFTVAAASNMQNRLVERLGGWSMLPDEHLRQELLRLGENPESLDRERLRQARTLFARALETPGGLRIQTIHAFASTILKRFPLEAGVSPQFNSLDDLTALRIREEVLDSVCVSSPATFASLADHVSATGLNELVEEISGNRAGFAGRVSEDDLCRIFDLPLPLCPPTERIRQFLTEADAGSIRELTNLLLKGSSTDLRAADRLKQLNFNDPSMTDFEHLASVFLFGEGAAEPFMPKFGRFPTKAVREQLGALASWLEDFMNRVCLEREMILRAAAAEKSLLLHRFAGDLLAEYELRKSRDSSLDFEDLILKTLALLRNPETAQWVLFKLDGGIDHILVDEAQDVSRPQWNIISGIADEFTSGKGAREGRRTVFAVGDEKQSIYGFQGAAPEKFEEMRDHFRRRYTRAGQEFLESDLQFSFRSSRAILEVVDRIFEDRPEPGFAGGTDHRAFKDRLPGRVDLWPVVEEPEGPVATEWYGARLLPGEMRAQARLAKLLAAEIRRMTDPNSGVSLDTGEGARPVEFGDILILFRRRNELFHSVINELKSAGLPVAGTDRMLLSESLAVLDVRALLYFLATPSDDLSLAAALRSPLFRMTEDELFSVAHGRNRRTLWKSLKEREADFSGIVAVIRDMQRMTDRLKPYELIEHLLTVHRGRELLSSRLGNEISEPIDAFLQQAISYDREEASTLTGFLEWSDNDLEIKRQLDQAGNEVRVMTIHGAKGLESPIVIVPDTNDRRATGVRDKLLTVDGVPLWDVTKNRRPYVLTNAVAHNDEQAENEHLRLMYVALTRAESWLIVAAAGKAGEESWHGIIESGLSKCSPTTVEVPDPASCDWPFGNFQRHSFGEWPAPCAPPERPETGSDQLPGWLHEAAPEPEQPPSLRSPSGLGGEKSLPVPDSAEKAEGSEHAAGAMERGTLVHLLLEHLPAGGGKKRRSRAKAILGCTHPDLDEDLFRDVYKEATRILDDPELKFLFGKGSLAEVGITASLKGLNGDRVLGYVDRLVAEGDRVLAVDFKSNVAVPSSESEMPEAILRQLGAYQEALEQIHPDRQVNVAVLWTRTGEFMQIGPELCRQALARSLKAPDQSNSGGPAEFDAFGEMFK